MASGSPFYPWRVVNSTVLAIQVVRRETQVSCGSPAVVVKPSENGLGDDGLRDVGNFRRLPGDPLADSLMGPRLIVSGCTTTIVFRHVDSSDAPSRRRMRSPRPKRG